MKKYVTTATFLLLAFPPILLSSFSTKKVNRTTAFTEYYYTSSNRLIQAGQSGSLDLTELSDTNYWSTNPSAFTFPSPGILLKAISFDQETMSDGGADGQLSLKEAINILRDYYVINNNFPAAECIVSDKASIKVKI
jgi:hypothetical protein